MSLKMTVARKVPARAGLVVRMLTTESAEQRDPDLDWAVLDSAKFTGAVGQVAVVSGADRPVMVVGIGPADDADSRAVRNAAVAAARAATAHRAIAVDLGDLPEAMDVRAAVAATAEGVELGGYEYLALRSDATPSALTAVTIIAAGTGVAGAATRGAAIARGVNVARDLVNEPGGSLTPIAFARKATSLARGANFSIRVMDLPAIRKAKLGGILGVNRGSDQQPRLVELTYEPAGRIKGTIALVGKGVTFDSGGLSLKTGQGMMTMKCDMAGAAAVLAATAVIAEIGADVAVKTYIPLTDNMPGGDATRPGDVLTIRNGKTVEVLNTDAEGRLILADALSLASEAGPDAIVDLATLTGAAMAALGPRYAAVMGTDDRWVQRVVDAGDRTDERLWPLPLPVEYRAMLDSTVADMKNIGGPLAGAITAGLFLKEFVAPGIAWAHVDIAGPSFTDTPFDEHPKGGTGFAVRALVELITSFEPLS